MLSNAGILALLCPALAGVLVALGALVAEYWVGGYLIWGKDKRLHRVSCVQALVPKEKPPAGRKIEYFKIGIVALLISTPLLILLLVLAAL